MGFIDRNQYQSSRKCKASSDCTHVHADLDLRSLETQTMVTRVKIRDKSQDILLTLIPLPDMPILGSSNSAANKDMMSKIWTSGHTIF